MILDRPLLPWGLIHALNVSGAETFLQKLNGDVHLSEDNNNAKEINWDRSLKRYLFQKIDLVNNIMLFIHSPIYLMCLTHPSCSLCYVLQILASRRIQKPTNKYQRTIYLRISAH